VVFTVVMAVILVVLSPKSAITAEKKPP